MFHNEHMIQRPFAVVTGASEGVGNELAKLFAAKGFDLIIADRNPVLTEVRTELLNYGGNVESHVLDLSTFNGVEQFYSAIKEFGHPVDAFAFHAKDGPHGPFLDTDLKEEIQTVRENILSPVHLLKRVMKDMVERSHGKILITSNLGPPEQAPFEAVYGAAKSFLFSFTEALRSEVRNEGISITTLLPNLYDMPTQAEKDLLEDPEELAKESFDALMSGRDYVIQASLRSRLQGIMTRLLPERAKTNISITPGQEWS